MDDYDKLREQYDRMQAEDLARIEAPLRAQIAVLKVERDTETRARDEAREAAGRYRHEHEELRKKHEEYFTRVAELCAGVDAETIATVYDKPRALARMYRARAALDAEHPRAEPVELEAIYRQLVDRGVTPEQAEAWLRNHRDGGRHG